MTYPGTAVGNHPGWELRTRLPRVSRPLRSSRQRQEAEAIPPRNPLLRSPPPLRTRPRRERTAGGSLVGDVRRCPDFLDTTCFLLAAPGTRSRDARVRAATDQGH